MKAAIILLFIAFLLACNSPENNTVVAEDKEDHPQFDTNFIKLPVLKLDSVSRHMQVGQQVEFIDIYPRMAELPYGGADTIHIKKPLLKRGFVLESKGWGNWAYGPQMVNYTMQKGDSLFNLTKFCYSTNRENYRITEVLEFVKK